MRLALALCLILVVEGVWAMIEVRASDPAALAVEVVVGEKVTRVAVAPPPVVWVSGEAVVIGEDAPNVWAAGTRLPQLVNPTGSVAVGAVVPGSVVVRARPGGPPYRVDTDYLLDERWAGLGGVATGAIPQGATVYLDYGYQLFRLDTVQAPTRGAVSIRRGEPRLVCPHPAGAAPGHRALANLWVRPGAQAIGAQDIYPIGRPPRFAAPHRAPTAGTRRRLAEGKAVTIVALGDSVTAGGEASKRELAFPEAFAGALRERYPKADIRLVNAGAGGTNSDYGLERLDRDVIAHHPHLVVVEFVNDMGWPPEKLRANYHQLVGRLRAVGAEVVILTPHFIWPEWMGNFALARATLEEIAAKEKVGLADGSARWEALRQVGIPYETLLVNCINHPDDRGHALFVEALVGLF